MKDNDLSAAPTPRYWVMAEVIFAHREETKEEKIGWFRKKEVTTVSYLPDLRTLSLLWNWSLQMGVRMEVIFCGDFAKDADDLWDTLDFGANPFNEYYTFGSIDDVVALLPYRPDIRGVVDLPSRVAHFGGRGLTLESLR